MGKLKILFYGVAFGVISVLNFSCQKDKSSNDAPTPGVSEQTWKEDNIVSAEAGSANYSFVSTGKWVGSSSEEWCSISPVAGEAAKNDIVLTYTANTTDVIRMAIISIKVGDSEPVMFKIHQSEAIKMHQNAVPNKWIYETMSINYLWNETIKDIKLDSTESHMYFLEDILDGVAANGNVNKEDINSDGDYFSNLQISSNSRESRLNKPQARGFGIYDVEFMISDNVGYLECYLTGVTPGSPADKLGLKRGDLILLIDGDQIEHSQQGMSNAKDKLVLNQQGSVMVATAIRTNLVAPEPAYIVNTGVRLSHATFDNNPIWMSKVLTGEGSGKKIGYLNYKSFEHTYDSDLIAAFSKFKSENVTELVLDLRYNDGGHLVSGAVAATAIVGSAKKDDAYLDVVYNATRTANGDGQVYKIGNATIDGVTAPYTPIAEALTSAIGVNLVYVLATNATSATSEQLINGLRGLGVEVRIIGAQTEGVNVGLEQFTVVIDRETRAVEPYTYDLFPVTFYAKNALGASDYDNGFTPDVTQNEFYGFPRNFGDPEEKMLKLALSWINAGVMPEEIKPASKMGRGNNVMVTLKGAKRSSKGSIVLNRY